MVSKRFSWRMEVQDSVENSIENSNLPDGHGGSKLSDQLHRNKLENEHLLICTVFSLSLLSLRNLCTVPTKTHKGSFHQNFIYS